MLSINIPDHPNTEQTVTLAGLTYLFIFSYNKFDERWRLSIYLGDIPVLLSIKIIEERSLIRIKGTPENFSHGDIQCMKFQATNNSVGRKNLGVDKEYELIYFSNEELGI